MSDTTNNFELDPDPETAAQLVKPKLDKISPSMCLAKWKQVTLHLQTGHTHSCHHPVTHKIPLEEIKIDPSALHNTSFKKKQRQKMLEGIRPKECDYCWIAEDADTNGTTYSDRITKSSEDWATPYLKEVTNKSWTENSNPSYVDCLLYTSDAADE